MPIPFMRNQCSKGSSRRGDAMFADSPSKTQDAVMHIVRIPGTSSLLIFLPLCVKHKSPELTGPSRELVAIGGATGTHETSPSARCNRMEEALVYEFTKPAACVEPATRTLLNR
eukprot:3615741-Karenia_brevis.AAC.1